MLDFSLGRGEETPPTDKTYDIIILGGGPAGLTAGLYAARAGRDTLVVEKGIYGGQIATTTHIENYPAFDGTGPELGERMHQQATKFGMRGVVAEATAVQVRGEVKQVSTTVGGYKARVLILAMGTHYADLGVPGEKEYRGRGVSYCATCDGPFFRNKVVAVVGGGDTACQEGLHLASLASKLVLIHRRNELRAAKVLQDRILGDPKVEMRWDTVVEAIAGNGAVNALRLRNVKTGERSEVPVNGVFILVGLVPNSELVQGQVKLDERGYILANARMETDVPGVFTAGDIRQTPLRQVVTAAGDGAIAAFIADDYLRGH